MGVIIVVVVVVVKVVVQLLMKAIGLQFVLKMRTAWIIVRHRLLYMNISSFFEYNFSHCLILSV